VQKWAEMGQKWAEMEKRGAAQPTSSRTTQPRQPRRAPRSVPSRVRPSFRTTQARSLVARRSPAARHVHIFSKTLPHPRPSRYADASACAYAHAHAHACCCACPRAPSPSPSPSRPRALALHVPRLACCFVFRPLVAYSLSAAGLTQPHLAPPPLATSCCQRTQQRPPSPQQHAAGPSAALHPPCPV
jgi:hypothetical protein